MSERFPQNFLHSYYCFMLHAAPQFGMQWGALGSNCGSTKSNTLITHMGLIKVHDLLWELLFLLSLLLIHSLLLGFIQKYPDKYTPHLSLVSPWPVRLSFQGFKAKFWIEWTWLLGAILNFTLVYLLALETFHDIIIIMFEHGAYSILDRFGALVYKRANFVVVGFGARAAGTTISNAWSIIQFGLFQCGLWKFSMPAKSFKGHIPFCLSPKTSLVPWRTLWISTLVVGRRNGVYGFWL